MGPLQHKVITVTNGQVEVHPTDVVISKKKLHEVCWHCPQGEATINFAQTPFHSDRFVIPKNGSVATGSAIGPPGTYKYSIIVRIPGDRREYVVDPTVVVEL